MYDSGLALPRDPAPGDGVVELRPWLPADVPRLVEICRDPEIVRWTRVPDGYTEDDALMHQAAQAERRRRGESLDAAIVATGEDRVVGSIDLRPQDDGRASLGYLVAADARGRGYARRAVALMAELAFSALGVRRLQIFTDVENLASQRVAEVAGFEREGVLRSYLELRGERFDAVAFSLLPGERQGRG